MKASNKTTQGIYFDLKPIFDELNSRFFEGKISAQLMWGAKRPASAQKRTIRLGSYHPLKRRIIIHPCLDQAVVPRMCLERILFHEMAHQKYPQKRSPSGKILSHYREFTEFEKTYPHLALADHWIKANLSRLLQF